MARAVSIGLAIARFLGTSSAKIIVSDRAERQADRDGDRARPRPRARRRASSGPSIRSAIAGSARKPIARLVMVMPTWAPESWVDSERRACCTPAARRVALGRGLRRPWLRSTVTKENSAATKTPHASTRTTDTPSSSHSMRAIVAACATRRTVGVLWEVVHLGIREPSSSSALTDTRSWHRTTTEVGQGAALLRPPAAQPRRTRAHAATRTPASPGRPACSSPTASAAAPRARSPRPPTALRRLGHRSRASGRRPGRRAGQRRRRAPAPGARRRSSADPALARHGDHPDRAAHRRRSGSRSRTSATRAATCSATAR